MFTLLTEKRDRVLVHQWGIWFATRDPERSLKVHSCRLMYSPVLTRRGIQLLTSLLSGKRRAEDDRILLQHIQETSTEVGFRFLEHLVLQRRSIVRLPFTHDLVN